MDFEPALKPPAPHLFSLPRAVRRGQMPDGYHLAQAEFAEAEAAFSAGTHAAAAKKFLHVAALLKAPSPRTTYADQYAAMRDSAYRNAAIAFELAEDGDGARAAFTAALKQDAECAALLKKLRA